MTRFTIYLSVLFSLPILSTTVGAAILTVAELVPNDLIITEYLADPVGVSDSLGEYFEIFNTTASEVDLTGLAVRDDGSNAFTVSGATIGVGSFAIFSSSDGMSLGLVPDYIYGGSMSLTNTDDEIGLFRPDDTLISKVTYSDGDFFGDGIAHELALLGPATSTSLFGPAFGTDFIAATDGLPLGNFGSPGLAGNTTIGASVVPVPAAVWMFASALSILGWVRRKPFLQRRVQSRVHSRGHTRGHTGDNRTGGFHAEYFRPHSVHRADSVWHGIRIFRELRS
jgi:hypothetical protein